MKLDQILIREAAGEYESVALSLRAVAASAGTALDYDDLCGAMGLSFTAVSTSAVSAPGWWMTYGRDLFLVPAGRLFGLELRELHPPLVETEPVTLQAAGEHFGASYKPLIVESLENRQPVLVWQGWPEYRWPFWGVLTAVRHGQLEGTTLWCEGQRVALTGPAFQCYAIEHCAADAPGRLELFEMAMRHADAYMNGAPFAAGVVGTELPEIVTGPAGFDAWERWLESDESDDFTADGSWNEHRQHAEFICSSRVSAHRFLGRMGEILSGGRYECVREAMGCCEAMMDELADSRDGEMVRARFASRSGRERLLETVHAAEAQDRRLAMCIEKLVADIR